jgi:alcohol dehydrogenase
MNPRLLNFQMSGRLCFGAGALAELPNILSGLSNGNVMIVTDPGLVKTGIVEKVKETLVVAGRKVSVFDQVEPDPVWQSALACLELARSEDAKVLIGLGGGSPIDIAKITAVLLTNGGSPLDYVGIDQVPAAGLPLIAIPTTAGTGSEVTPIAVLSDKEASTKKGVVSPFLYPSLALVDPELALGLPPRITAYTGMDALTHCIEAYTNRFAHPFIDSFAESGIRLIADSLRPAYCDGSNLKARTDMAMGSLYGGLCLGAVNTAAVHALAYPLGGTFNVPHGLANTVLLPHVMAVNVHADYQKFARLAELLGEQVTDQSPREAAMRSVEAVRQLAKDLGMDLRLRDLGVKESDIPSMAEGAMQVTRLMNNNPRRLTTDDCADIYRASW